MKPRRFSFYFSGGFIEVRAFSLEKARILAQAEAIKRRWDYTILEECEKC